VARLNGRRYEEMRVSILEFLDADVFNVSVENCVAFLDPLIESWNIDLVTFSMEIVLNRRLALGNQKKFEFVEREVGQPPEEEQGFKQFLRDPSMSGGASEEEIEFLKRLRFRNMRPTALYFYRELQNLRDPIHFRTSVNQTRGHKPQGQSQPAGSAAPMHKHLEARDIEKQLQLDGRRSAIKRWAGNKGKRGAK
jgi:hypothetical protein